MVRRATVNSHCFVARGAYRGALRNAHIPVPSREPQSNIQSCTVGTLWQIFTEHDKVLIEIEISYAGCLVGRRQIVAKVVAARLGVVRECRTGSERERGSGGDDETRVGVADGRSGLFRSSSAHLTQLHY